MDYHERIIDKVVNGFLVVKQHMGRPTEFELRAVLGLGNFYFLYMVYTNEKLTMSEIASFMYISKQQATQVADKMIASGYIERVYDEKDRRIIQIMITEKGKRALWDGIERVREKMKDKMACLSMEDFEKVEGAIDTLIEIARKMDLQSLHTDAVLRK